MNKIHAMRQQDRQGNLSYYEYAMKLLNKVSTAYSSEQKFKLILQGFNFNVQEKIVSMNANFESLEEMLLQLEEFNRLRKRNARTVSNDLVEFKKEMNDTSNRESNVNKALTQTQSKFPPRMQKTSWDGKAVDKKCFGCEENGYFRNQCLKNDRTETKTIERPKQNEKNLNL